MLAVVPIALAATLAISVLRISAFVLGIIIAMVAYGLVAQRVLDHSRSPHWMTASSYFAAVFCMVAGGLVIRGLI